MKKIIVAENRERSETSACIFLISEKRNYSYIALGSTVKFPKDTHESQSVVNSAFVPLLQRE